MYIPTFDDVQKARERIRPHVHRTPVLTSSFFNIRSGAELFFKCENFQKAGVFKVRGASNAVFGLDDTAAARGVATHSSGNHALSLSYAAGRRSIAATVVMPRTAPEAKKAAVRAYGGTVIECVLKCTAFAGVIEIYDGVTKKLMLVLGLDARRKQVSVRVRVESLSILL